MSNPTSEIAIAFESVSFNLRNMRENLDAVQADLEEFGTKNPYRKIVETDPKTGDRHHKLIGPKSFPDAIRGRVGTLVNDLRHTLDQAACAAYEVVSKKTAPRNLYFPIASDPKSLGGTVSKNFPPELWDTFVKFETYPSREDGTGTDYICFLSKAAQNKHRFTFNVRPNIRNFGLSELILVGGVRPFLPPRQIDGTNDFLLAMSKPKVDFEINLSHCEFLVYLDNAGPLTGHDCISTLNYIFEMVKVIVTEIESDCAKILST